MKVAVTGGGGFLGRRIVEMLREEGHRVLSISRGHYPELEALGVECRQADLSDKSALRAALEGSDAAIHVAAKAGIWGKRSEFMATNVTGTENVLAACNALGIGRLVYTSSPSVCFDGQDHLNASNDLPRAERFISPYPESKALAEALVLDANSPQLATVALRPHLIFGPRDPHLVPRLLESAAQGRLARVGNGRNLVSLTHVDNAAFAHVCALRVLEPGAPCAGRAYFVCNKETVVLWDWINDLLEQLKRAPVTRSLPLSLARAVGALCEATWTLLPLRGEPPMTRFVALQLARSHSYDLGPLERDLGYREKLDMATATAHLVADLRMG
ncbi:MAG TPA: NAD-dependent epimerase/dehydratase family protein [Planctomycetes bacterium]|nr:NAD-dependent epimerase/dehydratase family protein [Planctomycetota bacterium]HIK61125.1 NAD-dependent epimerase/dehydratase family protein [Planctomycetota bacterium]